MAGPQCRCVGTQGNAAHLASESVSDDGDLLCNDVSDEEGERDLDAPKSNRVPSSIESLIEPIKY